MSQAQWPNAKHENGAVAGVANDARRSGLLIRIVERGVEQHFYKSILRRPVVLIGGLAKKILGLIKVLRHAIAVCVKKPKQIIGTFTAVVAGLGEPKDGKWLSAMVKEILCVSEFGAYAPFVANRLGWRTLPTCTGAWKNQALTSTSSAAASRDPQRCADSERHAYIARAACSLSGAALAHPSVVRGVSPEIAATLPIRG